MPADIRCCILLYIELHWVHHQKYRQRDNGREGDFFGKEMHKRFCAIRGTLQSGRILRLLKWCQPSQEVAARFRVSDFLSFRARPIVTPVDYRCLCSLQQFPHAPNMIRNTSGHGGRHTDALMTAAKIVERHP